MKIKLFIALLAFGLSFISLSAQNETEFDRMWKMADSLEAQEMIRDAYGMVQDIDLKARREKNYPQQVRAMVYQFKYSEKLQEVNLARQLRQMKDEMQLMPMPHKAVLQSMTGSVYLMIADDYADYDDEQTEPDTNDPATWPEEQLRDSAEKYLFAAIQDEAALAAVAVENYAVLLELPDNMKRYRPTLYDVLAFRLFEFYTRYLQDDYENIYEPIVPFFFSDAEEFASEELSVDAGFEKTYTYKALTLIQKLLRRYINTGNTDALVMADIRRVEYCRSMPGLPSQKMADSLTIAWYEREIEKHKKSPCGNRIAIQDSRVNLVPVPRHGELQQYPCA